MDYTLVLLAAGKGSRYGGLKQVKRFGEQMCSLAEFAAYDALLVGFTRVVFVVNDATIEYFEGVIRANYNLKSRCICVKQDIGDVPFDLVNVDREKPWGTAHALWSARNVVNGPFVVVNGDDFYGRDAYKLSYEFFEQNENDFAMVSYELNNTLSPNGTVSRAICVKDGDNLKQITEFTKLAKLPSNKIIDETTHTEFTGNELVSVNFWCLRSNIFDCIKLLFEKFLNDQNTDLYKDEFYLPNAIVNSANMLNVNVKVLKSSESNWHGVTYAEDDEALNKSLHKLTENNQYPKSLLNEK